MSAWKNICIVRLGFRCLLGMVLGFNSTLECSRAYLQYLQYIVYSQRLNELNHVLDGMRLSTNRWVRWRHRNR